MAYSVYTARFKTERGTYRTHVAHTRNLNLRKHMHRKKPPAWLKPRAGEPAFSVLEEGLQTKEDALASEALHSARVLVASPELARGGPWVKPTLPDGALEEAKTAARVRSFRELFSLAQGNKKGLLWKHLKDLEFVPRGPAAFGADGHSRGLRGPKKEKWSQQLHRLSVQQKAMSRRQTAIWHGIPGAAEARDTTEGEACG